MNALTVVAACFGIVLFTYIYAVAAAMGYIATSAILDDTIATFKQDMSWKSRLYAVILLSFTLCGCFGLVVVGVLMVSGCIVPVLENIARLDI